ncbi:MAG: hypothetical protein Q7S22_07440 [Candidatus Micrarchaeota archaeon]|nr:hypothetical protein [Candidatus Micrarchaeota archaeon]
MWFLKIYVNDLPIRPPQPKGCGFIRADANVATATLRPLSKGQLGGQSCVNSALPPKVKTMSFRAELTHDFYEVNVFRVITGLHLH